MTIQFNTDNNLSASVEHSQPLIAELTEELSRYSSHITRLEVHLSDEDGPENGQNDIRCMLEARIEGRQPIAVINKANNNEQAVSGAIDKIKTSLDTLFGRLSNH
jgi:ribosome-associated translation inhibitor RaiA